MKNRSATARRSKPSFGFISDTIAELKKVVWLSRREVVYLTALVLLVTVTAGLVLGIIDYGFSRLVNDLFLPGK
jgi:preprotein translocase subunit SecE